MSPSPKPTRRREEYTLSPEELKKMYKLIEEQRKEEERSRTSTAAPSAPRPTGLLGGRKPFYGPSSTYSTNSFPYDFTDVRTQLKSKTERFALRIFCRPSMLFLGSDNGIASRLVR